ncbi:MAG: replication protein [Oscillospiraceae bacterium]|nr:replication protein [Oscillospiraceae bacterium]
MPRKKSARKYLLTINNPQTHGFDHARIRSILSDFPGIDYWCMCDETGDKGTYHTHIYAAFRNSVMFDTVRSKFYGAHIDPAKGKHRENRDYIRKEGKWLDDAKHETNHPETFEEWGELPPDKSRSESQAEQIMQMVMEGKTNAQILREMPTAYSKINYIEQARQTLLQEQHENEWRNLSVTYIWGETGAGKTRSVMDLYGYPNVYRVMDYAHPFDGYKGQDVILFDEFRSQLPLSSMLVYLDGYPVELPCRYANKQARFTKVFLVSNIPLEQQYPTVQMDKPGDWAAFRRRIQVVQHKTRDFEELPPEDSFDPDAIFGESGV